MLLAPLFTSNINANEIDASEKMESNAWKTWKEKLNKMVLYRPAKQKNLIEIKAHLKIPTTTKHFIEFLHKDSLIPKWLDNVNKVEVEIISPEKSNLIAVFKEIWPVSPRVMAIESNIVSVDTKTTLINVTNKKVQLDPKYIQVTLYSGSWTIQQTEDQHVIIDYQFVADANGDVPYWLANKLALKSIWKTLNNIQKHFRVDTQ